jgi:hypothetical protein
MAEQKKLINSVSLEGLLYEHKLELKVTGPDSKAPGTEYLAGEISIATDGMECVNVVPVHFSYVTPKTSTGKENRSYGILKKIYDGDLGTVMKDGKENAAKLHIDTAIDLNEFYTEREGKEELVSAKRLEGGFINQVSAIDESITKRNFFKTDMLITNVSRVEANEEKGIPEYAKVGGYIFNFRREALPVVFTATNPAAIDYFEGLDASGKNPTFTQVWGSQISQTIITKHVTESAFGESRVEETTRTRKDYVITGAANETYTWDSEETLTAREVSEMMAKREVKLATIKKNREEYMATKNSAIKSVSIADYSF